MTSFVTSAGSAYLLAVLFGRTEQPLDTYYLGLCATLPELGDDGATITEPDVTTGYARAPVPNNDANWNASGYYEVFNAQQIFWPTVPEASGWGELTAFALLDVPDLLSGRLLLCGSLNPPLSPIPFTQVVVQPDQLVISATSISPSYQPL
jgi:hypothetical protein